MGSLCNNKDVDDAVLQNHVLPHLRSQFKADYHTAVSSSTTRLVDVQVDVDSYGTTARTWCVSSTSFPSGLTRENVAILEWELREHCVWVCVSIKAVSGGVGF